MKKLAALLFSMVTAVSGHSETPASDINNLPDYFKNYQNRAIKLLSADIAFGDNEFELVPLDLNEDFYPDVIELYSPGATYPTYYYFILDRATGAKKIFYDKSVDGLNGNEVALD